MQFEKHCSALLPLVKSLRALHVNQNSRHTEVHYPGIEMQRLRLKIFLFYTKKGQEHNCQSHWAGGHPSHIVQVRSGQSQEDQNMKKEEGKVEKAAKFQPELVCSLKFRQCHSN